jgi:hypothetical protein
MGDWRYTPLIRTWQPRPHWFWGLTASYAVGTGGSYGGDEAAGSWNWPLTPIYAEVKNAWSYTSSS